MIAGGKQRQLDAEARILAQRVFDRPMVLEAGAGTGKTAALVARILAWSLGPGWERAEAETTTDNPKDRPEFEVIAAKVLDGVVAITFTEDAAAEMTRRVAQGFDALRRDKNLIAGRPWPEDDPIVVGLDRSALVADLCLVPDRAKALLTVLEHLRTGTIHAFARALIARFPVESGLHPAFTVDADGEEAAACVDRAVEELLEPAYGGGPEHADAMTLAASSLGPAELRAATLRLVDQGTPAAALRKDPLRPERLAPVVADLKAGLRGFRPGAEAMAAVSKNSSVTIASAELVLALADEFNDGAEDPRTSLLAVRDWLASRPDAGKLVKRIGAWATKKRPTQAETEILEILPPEEDTALGRLASALKFIVDFEPDLFDAARRFLARLLDSVDTEKRRRGLAGFDDLLSGARRLLERHPAIVTLLRTEVTQLLVDEMQDTDADQAEIVRRLGLGDGPAPGLFLVGDPKQSIYGWRNADLAVFHGLVSEVKALGGLVLSLTVNFRSLQAVLDEVSRVVGPVMTASEGLQPAFEGLIASRAEPPDSHDEIRAAVEHWSSHAVDAGGEAATTSAAVAAEIEAEAVARDAAALMKRGTKAEEMAILMRSRSHQAEFLGALRRHGVPYVVGRDPNYYRTREVTEAMALVRLILDPTDLLALVTVLRSPMVGVPDAALRPLWRGGLPAATTTLGEENAKERQVRTIVEEAADEVDRLGLGDLSLEALGGWPEAVTRFTTVLEFLRRSFATDPPDVFVENVRRSVPLEPLAACRYPGDYRLANLDRFFRDLDEILSDGASAGAVLARLRRAERERPDESSGRPRADARGVRVLTIHGAKGLGFEHVWLVQAHAGGGRRSGGRPTSVVATADGWEMVLFGRATPGWAHVLDRRQQIEEAERVRLLYVALTRAKNRLVTVSNARPASGKNHRSFLGLLESREGGWLADPDGDVDIRRDTENARWVLLGHPDWDRTSPGSESTDAVPTQTIDPSAIKADATRLDTLTAEAAARQERQWLATASKLTHDDWREQVAGRFESDLDEPAVRLRGVDFRDVATAAGTAVHAVLESFDFAAADAAAEFQARRDEIIARLEVDMTLPALREAIRDRIAGLTDGFRSGPLWPRFLAIGPHVVARELPLVTAPGDARAVGAVTGAIDLLYEDPDSGILVVVDYKTDAVADDREAVDRAHRYDPQLAAYARAIQQALGLDSEPRRELWFLGTGSVIRRQ